MTAGFRVGVVGCSSPDLTVRPLGLETDRNGFVRFERMDGMVQARLISSVSEVVGLWAAHESSSSAEAVTGVMPKGLSNYRREMVGSTEAEQVHAFVSSFKTYRFSFPCLWWSAFRGPISGFDASAYFRSYKRMMVASREAAMGELGYEGRLPSTVLELFLGCIERRLETEPLEVFPRMEAPCEADELDAIVTAAMERAARRSDGIRSF